MTPALTPEQLTDAVHATAGGEPYDRHAKLHALLSAPERVAGQAAIDALFRPWEARVRAEQEARWAREVRS